MANPNHRIVAAIDLLRTARGSAEQGANLGGLGMLPLPPDEGAEMNHFENCDCPTCEFDRLKRAYKTLFQPLPWWRRMPRWDWLFVAVCLAGAAACIWGMR